MKALAVIFIILMAWTIESKAYYWIEIPDVDYYEGCV